MRLRITGNQSGSARETGVVVLRCQSDVNMAIGRRCIAGTPMSFPSYFLGIKDPEVCGYGRLRSIERRFAPYLRKSG